MPPYKNASLDCSYSKRTKSQAESLILEDERGMLSRMSLAMLLMAKFAGNGDDAIRHGMSGIFSREEHGGLRHRSNIIDLYDELRPSLYGYLVCLGLAPQEADDIIRVSIFRSDSPFRKEIAVRPGSRSRAHASQHTT
jgi:hypothetical protein